ncbi:hypothetical protein ABPG75_003240 [Micractinium tetrahymenae]
MGGYKAALPWWKNVALAVAAGCYTAMFCSLLLMVGPNSHGLAATNPGLARYLTSAISLPFQLMVILGGIASISAAKLAVPLKQTFVKAILANWFVCLAVWQASAAQTGPLSAFIAVGFEHCITNMVIIPLGILTGVEGVNWGKFLLHNLLPVTLGNIFAGVVCVATLYSLTYGALGKKIAHALGESST